MAYHRAIRERSSMFCCGSHVEQRRIAMDVLILLVFVVAIATWGVWVSGRGETKSGKDKHHHA
jgi:hypothetical protein